MFRTNPFRGQFAVAMMAALVVLCVALTHANPMVETHTETNPVLGSVADAEKYCTDLGGVFKNQLHVINIAMCINVKRDCTENGCNTFCENFGKGIRPVAGAKCPANNSKGECVFQCQGGKV